MLSRNNIYSLAKNLYNEAKFQLGKKIFVSKQLNTPKKTQMQQIMLLSNFRNGSSQKIIFVTHLCLRLVLVVKRTVKFSQEEFQTSSDHFPHFPWYISPSLWPRIHNWWVTATELLMQSRRESNSNICSSPSILLADATLLSPKSASS